MSEQAVPSLRFGSSWQTQYRFTQAIGRGLSELSPAKVTVVIGGGARGLEAGDIDLVYTKSVNNEHQYTGKGIYGGKVPARWLRTIAWFPQEDRFFFAVAPWVGVSSFEEIVAKKPALKMVGRSAEPVLKEYGFSYEEIERWGGRIESMEHTAREAKEHYDRGALDACFGDGSAYDGTCWKWMANRGYRFLDIRPDVMERLEQDYGLRRNITSAGFFPGIDHNLLALDDSHVVLSCHERLDDNLAYLLAKVIDERKREIECSSIQVSYGESDRLPLTEPTLWSSLTGQLERQWDAKILGAPLHPGAERYYRERG